MQYTVYMINFVLLHLSSDRLWNNSVQIDCYEFQLRHWTIINFPLLEQNNPILLGSLAGAQAVIKVSGHQHRWLAGGYDLEIGHFQKWLAWWLSGG